MGITLIMIMKPRGLWLLTVGNWKWKDKFKIENRDFIDNASGADIIGIVERGVGIL